MHLKYLSNLAFRFLRYIVATILNLFLVIITILPCFFFNFYFAMCTLLETALKRVLQEVCKDFFFVYNRRKGSNREITPRFPFQVFSLSPRRKINFFHNYFLKRAPSVWLYNFLKTRLFNVEIPLFRIYIHHSIYIINV